MKTRRDQLEKILKMNFKAGVVFTWLDYEYWSLLRITYPSVTTFGLDIRFSVYKYNISKNRFLYDMDAAIKTKTVQNMNWDPIEKDSEEDTTERAALKIYYAAVKSTGTLFILTPFTTVHP